MFLVANNVIGRQLPKRRPTWAPCQNEPKLKMAGQARVLYLEGWIFFVTPYIYYSCEKNPKLLLKEIESMVQPNMVLYYHYCFFRDQCKSTDIAYKAFKRKLLFFNFWWLG